MFVDTHCHLDFEVFDHDLDQVLNDALSENISHFIVPGVSINNWKKILKLSRENDHIHPAIGLHPCFIDMHQDDHLVQLKTLLMQYPIHLIGEIGLDKRIEQFDKQRIFFEKQIQLASIFKLPVILHSVKAHNEIIEIIKRINYTYGGIIHAFNGSIEIAQTYLDLGFKLGIGGIITYPQNQLVHLISQLPLTSFVLETDSPDMPIKDQKGNKNTPNSIIRIFDIVCSCRNESKLEIEKQLWHNSEQFLK